MRLLPFAILLTTTLPLAAQGSETDYQRAGTMRQRWSGKLQSFRPTMRWLPDDKGVWWRQRDRSGKATFVLVDTATGSRKTASKPQELGLPTTPSNLQPRKSWRASPSRQGPRTSITFVNKLKRQVRLFWVDYGGRTKPYGEIAPGATKKQSTFTGHVWVLDFVANDLAGIFVAEPDPGRAIVDQRSRRQAMRGREPDRRATARKFRVSIRNDNVIGRTATGETFPLTTDGSPKNTYRRPRHWSPSGTRVLGFRIQPVERRRIHMVESSPRDGSQPKLHSHTYVKPGDRLERKLPVLFDLTTRRQITVDSKPFADAYSITRVHWAPDSSNVYCLYNQRGHQRLSVLAIDAATGAVRTLVNETSKTFVDYSQKLTLYWLEDGLLWASERDGWNHLYRYDLNGNVVRQVTKGKWVMRSLERVDEAAGRIWFTAMGIDPDQDPYHRHLARVDLDGKNLTVLTKGDGSHSWTYSPGRRFFVDRWSRVDQPAITVLRRAKDSKQVAELGRDDASRLLAAGFRPPERFVAKGRDGRTDIHGILIRPSNFDAKRRYPVIESIYAGPHDHHVPKTFGLDYRNRMLAELGFIIVRIDGMGTNWRSKAFHDVCWQNLKDAGFPDRVAWLRAAAAKYPHLDLRKVGIFGGSAGGQNALSALLHHGDFYYAAVADCGCHDNRMDKIWWNEAWMGRMGPHYAASSNVTHAAKLKGKLMLTVGELDRNVDPASTMQVVDALIRADKDFDLIVVPGGGHGVGERPYLVRRRQDFFVRHLHCRSPRWR